MKPLATFFGEGNGTPLQYSCLENPTDEGAWWAAVHGVMKSRTRLSDFTFTFHFRFSLSCIGEGNGNPLQCSCLENPRAGGAWWAAVYGVAQSRTRLKWQQQQLLISESVFNYELIFFFMGCVWSPSLFFCMWIFICLMTICLKKHFFPYWMVLAPLLKNHLTVIWGFISELSIPQSWLLYLFCKFWNQEAWVFHYCSFSILFLLF